MLNTPRCIICGSSDTQVSISLENVPVESNIPQASYQEAINVKRGDIELVACNNCGHLHNHIFDEEKICYSDKYETALEHSAHFRQFAKQLTEDFIERYQLTEKHVVEIGCGTGFFLKQLCEAGNNTGTGFEPSRPLSSPEESQLKFFQAPFNAEHLNRIPDFLVCRHTLEHISDPNAFMADLQDSLGQYVNLSIYFEVPNASFMLKNNVFWDIIYEHYSYFTPQSLTLLFQRQGFDVNAVDELFEQQFLGIEARIKPNSDQSAGLKQLQGNWHEALQQFEQSYKNTVDSINQALNNLSGNIVLWGAGSKGIMLLNLVAATSKIDYVVDLNPSKQGLYIAGSGQKIIDPQFLESFRPDHVVITNNNYRNEISLFLQKTGLKSQLHSIYDFHD